MPTLEENGQRFVIVKEPSTISSSTERTLLDRKAARILTDVFNVDRHDRLREIRSKLVFGEAYVHHYGWAPIRRYWEHMSVDDFEVIEEGE